MKKLIIVISMSILFCSINTISAKENFFEVAKNKFEKKRFDESKFLFQRNIVFNPKDSASYLYLAKIYNHENNEKKELKYLETTLLLEPDNEDALYMLIDIRLKKSNFSEVKKLFNNFKLICTSMCDKIETINERLKNIEVEDESKQ